jgi:phage terminase large subunit-like protein
VSGAAAEYTARDELEYQALQRELHGVESLHDFIGRVNPQFPPPPHLYPILDLLEEARVNPLWAVINLPPRHRKTTTLLNAIAWLLRYEPAMTHAYVTSNLTQARRKSKIAREIAKRAGCQLDPRMSGLSTWGVIHNGMTAGGLYATGWQGGLNGEGITGLIVLDDLLKNRKQADSEGMRDDIWDFCIQVALSRMEPGASMILTATRWHDDDPTGRLLAGEVERAAKEAGVKIPEIRQVVLPALCEDEHDGTGRALGEALWPAQKSEGELRIMEILDPWAFAALYQQHPTPKGGKLFKVEPARFPMSAMMYRGVQGLRGCIAVDPAASEDDKANPWALAVLMAEGYGVDMRVWMVDLDHYNADPISGVERLVKLYQAWQLPIVMEGGVVGASPIASIRRQHPEIPIYVQPADRSKWTRAQPAAALWNRHCLLVPEGVEWAANAIRLIMKFTGRQGGEDDIPDAISHGVNWLADAVWDEPNAYGARPLGY